MMDIKQWREMNGIVDKAPSILPTPAPGQNVEADVEESPQGCLFETTSSREADARREVLREAGKRSQRQGQELEHWVQEHAAIFLPFSLTGMTLVNVPARFSLRVPPARTKARPNELLATPADRVWVDFIAMARSMWCHFDTKTTRQPATWSFGSTGRKSVKDHQIGWMKNRQHNGESCFFYLRALKQDGAFDDYLVPLTPQGEFPFKDQHSVALSKLVRWKIPTHRSYCWYDAAMHPRFLADFYTHGWDSVRDHDTPTWMETAAQALPRARMFLPVYAQGRSL